MIELLNGRSRFYQWDINQKVKVADSAIKEIHFDNGASKTALVCAVYDYEGQRVADVPNILLQNAYPIAVYAFCGECVRFEKLYPVEKRNKPADYVYTETEIKRYESLESRIKAVEEKEVDLSNYYTKDEVNTALDGVEVDLSDYYTKQEVDTALDSVEVDLSNYYTKQEVENAIENAETDLSNYYTKQEVDSALEGVEADVDLTDYYTKAEVDAAIAQSGGGNGGSGATPDWNAQEGEPGYIANKTHGEIMGLVEILPETVFSLETEGMTATPLNGSLTVGEMAVVTYNGVDYESEIISVDADGMTMKMCGNPMLALGDETLDNGLPYVFIETPAEYQAMGVYAMFIPLDMFESGAATVSVKSVGKIIQKLDDKYINKPNWNAADGEAGHIENRTHYAANNPVFSYKGGTTEKEYFNFNQLNLNAYKITDLALDYETLKAATYKYIDTEVDINKEIDMNVSTIAQQEGNIIVNSNIGLFISITDIELAENQLETKIPAVGLYAITGQGKTIKIYVNGEVVKKIDNKYIDLTAEKKYLEIYYKQLGEDKNEIEIDLTEKEYNNIVLMGELYKTDSQKRGNLVIGVYSKYNSTSIVLTDLIPCINDDAGNNFMLRCENKHGYLDITLTDGERIYSSMGMTDEPPIKKLVIHSSTKFAQASRFTVWGVTA